LQFHPVKIVEMYSLYGFIYNRPFLLKHIRILLCLALNDGSYFLGSAAVYTIGSQEFSKAMRDGHGSIFFRGEISTIGKITGVAGNLNIGKK
jgi:hypothetical protein